MTEAKINPQPTTDGELPTVPAAGKLLIDALRAGKREDKGAVVVIPSSFPAGINPDVAAQGVQNLTGTPVVVDSGSKK